MDATVRKTHTVINSANVLFANCDEDGAITVTFVGGSKLIFSKPNEDEDQSHEVLDTLAAAIDGKEAYRLTK